MDPSWRHFGGHHRGPRNVPPQLGSSREVPNPATPQSTNPQLPIRSREEWRRVVRDELGGEGVDIELTDSLIDASFDRALELFNRYRPMKMWFPFDLQLGETLIINFFAEAPQASPDGNPWGFVRNVLDVIFSDRNRRILGPRAGFLEGYYLRWGYGGPRLFYELHVAERLYERLTGSRPDWRWDPASRKLYVSSPSRDTRIMVLATREKKLEEIEYDQMSEFLKAAVASAKTKLARILGARGPIPGAAGAIETDAAQLRAEGREDWKDVESTLKTAISSVPPPEYIG